MLTKVAATVRDIVDGISDNYVCKVLSVLNPVYYKFCQHAKTEQRIA